MFACFAFFRSAQGEEAKTQFIERVRIDITADENFEREASSYLKREFRSLHDVEETSNKPDLRIRILAMSIKSIDGHSHGFAFSIVVSRPLDQEYLNDMLSSALDAKHLKFLDSITKDTEVILGEFSRTGGPTELEVMCKKIVADIDAQSR